MDVLLYCLLGVAVGAIFCIYRRHLFDCWTRGKRLRERVAYMLWAAANKNSST